MQMVHWTFAMVARTHLTGAWPRKLWRVATLMRWSAWWRTTVTPWWRWVARASPCLRWRRLPPTTTAELRWSWPRRPIAVSRPAVTGSWIAWLRALIATGLPQGLVQPHIGEPSKVVPSKPNSSGDNYFFFIRVYSSCIIYIYIFAERLKFNKKLFF